MNGTPTLVLDRATIERVAARELRAYRARLEIRARRRRFKVNGSIISPKLDTSQYGALSRASFLIDRPRD